MKNRWIAIFLMAVFVFIHVAKVLHSHENSGPVCTESKVTAHVEKSNPCTVCDFHFTKDSNYPTTSFELKEPCTFPVQHVVYHSHVASSIGLSYSDRGPPAFSI